MIEGVARTLEVQPHVWHTDDGRHLALALDSSIYSLGAVLKAAYKFTDRHYVFVTRAPEHPDKVIVILTPKAAEARVSAALMGEYSNELVDQRLREALEQEFGHLRTMIVAQAFAEGDLLDPERDEGDYRSDPRGAGRRR